MNYIIHFDIAAFVVTLTVLFHFIMRKSIRTKAVTLFYVLIYLQLFTTTLDIATSLMIDGVIKATTFSLYLWNVVYLVAFNSITPVFVAYLICITKKDGRPWSSVDHLKIWPLLAVDYILLLTTPFTKAVFYIDKEGQYQHNTMFYALYLISIIYLVIAVTQVSVNKNSIKKEQRNMVYFYIIATIVAVVVQMFITKVLIMQFTISIAFFLVYLSLENPDNYLDSRLGIFNREGFILSLRGALDNRKKFRLVGVYISGLKYLNETIGVGNKKLLLQDIAQFLCDLNGSDNVFRLSNTKFVIKVEDEEREQMVIDGITERFEKPFVVQNTDVPLIPAIAVLGCPEDADTLNNIMDLLDYSLNELMDNSDITFIRASEDVVEKRHRESIVLQILNKAIKDKSFEMYYQPIYSVAERRYTSAEALLRLKNSDVGYISPDEFIPIAEKNGMILELGEFVFRSVCEYIIENKVQRYGIEQIHINLSVVQCMQEDLAEKFMDIMNELKLPSNRIKLEVTETAAVVSSNCLSMNMNALSECGIKFALDDYGTGFANAISLIEYPYSTIKVDKSVVWAAMDSDEAKKVLTHTVAMLKSLKMSIVAEGVETYEQSEELIAMGFDYLQGYYYSKPISGKDFIELVSIDLKM